MAPLTVDTSPMSQSALTAPVSCTSRRRKFISQDTQELLDELDQVNGGLEQIVQVTTPAQENGRRFRRLDTASLLEKLDERSQEVEQLLQVGVDLLTVEDHLQGVTKEALDHDDEFCDSESTTATSCGESCSACSSPRSFVLSTGDEVTFDGFNLSQAAEELKQLHRELYAVRKQLSGRQVERLTNAIEVMTQAVGM